MAFTGRDINRYNELILEARKNNDYDLVEAYRNARNRRVSPDRLPDLTQKADPSEWKEAITGDMSYFNEPARQQAINLRNAGVSKEDLQRYGTVDLGGGYTLNPVTSMISGKDYSYQPGKYIGTGGQERYGGYTTYGDEKFHGKYDPNVLSQITEEDWETAVSGREEGLQGRLSNYEGYIDDEYLNDLYRFGGGRGGAVNVGTDHYQDMYDKASKNIYDQYRQYYMEDAYKIALGRQGDDYTNLLDQALETDYSGYYKNLMDQDRQSSLDYIQNYEQPGLKKPTAPQPEQPIFAPGEREAQLAKQQTQQAALQPGSTTTLNGVDYVQTAQGLERAPQTATTAPDPVSTGTEYAEAMLPAAPAPSSPTTPAQQNPWSKDFESGMMDIFKGYGNTLQSYLGQAQQPNKPSFSLSGYTQSPARNANTPVNSSVFGGQPQGTTQKQSYGKAGNNQSIWR